MSEKCEYCGADKNAELSDINHYGIYKCGSDGAGFQSAKCRITQLEAEKEQWAAALAAAEIRGAKAMQDRCEKEAKARWVALAHTIPAAIAAIDPATVAMGGGR